MELTVTRQSRRMYRRSVDDQVDEKCNIISVGSNPF